MKIAIAQLNYHIGNFEGNLQKMLKATAEAKGKGADLIIFGELSTTGYPPRDFLEFRDFIRLAEESVDALRAASDGIGIIVGSPTINPFPEGKDLHNSVYLLYNQETLHIQHKTLLPTYDVFDEYRYFEPNKVFEIIEIKGVKIALTICEDLWNMEDDPLYTFCPMDELLKFDPKLIINIAASPFNFLHAGERKRILKKNALKYQLPVFYVNQIGAQTELIFDGGSLVLDKLGEEVARMKYFEEDFAVYELGNLKRHLQPEKTAIEKIHQALLLGLRDYFHKMNFKQAILGLSGGIDSAVVLALAVEALGKENVLSVLMPSVFSSAHSVSDSEQMCTNLQTPFLNLPINPLYEAFLIALQEPFKGLEFNVTEENIQARIRGLLLMAMSNKFGNIVLNTSNKSELAVGYGTLYGDMCGGLSVIGDLYKTTVYELAHHINRENEIIPLNIINKPPSAELRPGQKDSDSLPDYAILDKILFLYIEKFQSPDQIIAEGFDSALVNRVLKMVNTNEYKRKQFAPILRVSTKAFGLGRRMPIVGKYLG